MVFFPLLFSISAIPLVPYCLLHSVDLFVCCFPVGCSCLYLFMVSFSSTSLLNSFYRHASFWGNPNDFLISGGHTHFWTSHLGGLLCGKSWQFAEQFHLLETTPLTSFSDFLLFLFACLVIRYLFVGLMHIPCYAAFALIVKAKHFFLPRWFPRSYRSYKWCFRS